MVPTMKRRGAVGKVQLLAAGLAVLGLAGCGGESTEDPASSGSCDGGKCDEADSEGQALSCAEALVDLSGNQLKVEDMLANGDAVAELVLNNQEGSCALSVADMATVLASSCRNHRSAFVSERAQRLGAFTDYRSVTMMDCDQGAVFLHYPILARELGGGDLSEHLKEVAPAIMAEDKVSGVFNYYQSTGQDIRFFGNSLDMLKGADLEKLEEIQGEEEDFKISFGVERSCASCHPGGGLLMKELEAPWVHWEPDFASPQTDELVSSASAILGDLSDGIDLEFAVRDGNDTINKSRIDHVVAGLGSEFDVGDLLRPLFCTDEFNIGSGFSEDVSSFRFDDVVLDRGHFTGLRIRSSNEEYQRILDERGSHLLTEALGAPRFKETVGGFTFMHRARIDEEYIDSLVNQGIIDSELVTDIRLIDFTRSLYSEERCDLLSIAEKVSADAVEGGGEKIRDGMIEVLSAQDSLSPAENDLLTLLQEENTDSSRFVTPFVDACDSRTGRGDTGDMLEDYLEYEAQVRKRAADREAGEPGDDPSFMQFRFPGVNGFTMPIDDQPTQAGFRFHPQTCETTTDYVRLTDGMNGGGDPGDDGGDVPDDVEDSECCVTCSASQACGNGCISSALTCHQPEGCACEG